MATRLSVVILCGVIRGYQYVSSFWGPRCRFVPSCSDYTRQALLTKGLAKGLFWGARRVLKCHPWHPGGVDTIRFTKFDGQ